MRREALVSACLLLAAFSSHAFADVIQTWDWNSGGANWQYWVPNTDTPELDDGKNQAIKWESMGGYDGGGFVWTPLQELSDTFGAYWPAFMAPDTPVDDVELLGMTLSVWVNDFGSLASDPPLHFFIGQFDGKGTEEQADDEYVFFYHDTPIAVGDDTWVNTAFSIGGDSQWETLVRHGMAGVNPSDLYTNPQQWGFALPDDSLVFGANQYLGFDQLQLSVPEPSSLILLAGPLAVMGLSTWRRRKSRPQKRRQDESRVNA